MRKLLILAFSVFATAAFGQRTDSKPNIILVLADDLGYGEVGFNGQKIIKTPNMDLMAANGMILKNHYTAAPVCAPARCMILTGKHGGHAYIRGNDEWGERGDVWDFAKAAQDPNLEGQRAMPANTVTLAKILQQNGYATGMVGKWGLGAPNSESVPTTMGFDYFYGYNCQRQAHNLYPPHLWENTTKIKLNNPVIVPGTKIDSLSDPLRLDSYAQFQQQEYAPELMHAKALDFLDQNKDKPFFLYYASPLPHVPLQAPQDLVEEYVKILGEEDPYNGSKGYFPNRYPRATYAAMISLLDRQIGELKAKLEELGIAENTLILISSDNGPTFNGGVDSEYFKSSGPYTNGYGRTKGFVYEGGIKVPTIAYWPGKIQANSNSNHLSVSYDYLPTICELVGIDPPQGMDGKSFLGALFGKELKEPEYLFWDFPQYGGQQAVRMGKWKGIRQNISKGNLEIELYDLTSDPQELTNLASKHPEIVAKMEEIMKREHEPTDLVKFKQEALGDFQK